MTSTEAPFSFNFPLNDRSQITVRDEDAEGFENGIEFALGLAERIAPRVAEARAVLNLTFGGVATEKVSSSGGAGPAPQDVANAARWEWRKPIDPWPTDAYGPFKYTEGTNAYGPYARLYSAGGKDAPGAGDTIFSRGKPKSS